MFCYYNQMGMNPERKNKTILLSNQPIRPQELVPKKAY